MGFKITVNNFGITDTSLTYLSRLPINNLKVAASLIANISENEVVVKVIGALAKSMGADLIAEGVQTSEQRDRLTAQGYTLMQGTLFGKAVSVTEIAKG